MTEQSIFSRRLGVAVTVLASLAAAPGCGGGGGSDGDNGTAQAPPAFTQFTAPDDPTLLTAETPAGARTTFYGVKDDEGLTTAFRSLRFQSPEQVDDGTATWVHFADDGLIRRFEGAGGSIIDFERLSATEYLVSAVTPDGKVQANTVVDITQPPARRATVPLREARHPGQTAPDAAINRGPRGGRSISLTTDYSQAWRAKQPGRSLQTAGGNTAPVTAIVTECNDGRGVADAEVFFSAGTPGDSLPPTYLGTEDGTRRYRASIPLGNEPLSAESVRDACLSTGTLLGTACDASAGLREAGAPVFCAAAAGAIDTLLGGPSGEGAFIFAECQAGFFAVEGYCTSNDATPNGTADFICSNIGEAVVSHPGVRSELDRNQLTVRAHANLPGRGRLASEPVTLNPFTEEYPTFFIDYGGSIAIDELTTAPAAPEVGDNYVVTVQLACSTGANVTVQIEGADGYRDTAEFMPSNDEPLTVAVPGGRDSRRDIIRVLAVSPEPGPGGFLTASRDTVVVFEKEETTPEPPDDGPDDPTFDFSQVRMARLALRIGVEGTFFPDDGDPVSATRQLDEQDELPQETPPPGTGCPRMTFQQSPNNIWPFQFADEEFQMQAEGVAAGGIGMFVDPETCLTASLIGYDFQLQDEPGTTANVLRRIGIDVEDIAVRAAQVSDQELVYRLTGPALCTAITDFDFFQEEGNGSFSDDAPVCDDNSLLEVRFAP